MVCSSEELAFISSEPKFDSLRTAASFRDATLLLKIALLMVAVGMESKEQEDGGRKGRTTFSQDPGAVMVAVGVAGLVSKERSGI